MHNFIELAKEEVPQLENALKKIDAFLNNAPEGCLRWQNKKGKTYYYHQFMKENKWVRRYIKKGELSLAKMLAQKHYYISIRPILAVRSKSEVIIANILYQNRKDILYKYERPLEVMESGRQKTIYPDFTILNKHTGEITYWEHAGHKSS